MKKLHCILLFFLTLCFAICHSDTWTSIRGEKLEAKFIKYDIRTEEITVERDDDKKFFSIPETELIHTDRTKAIRLENKDIPDYWYTDYEKAKAENPDRRCLVLYRNNSKIENFELFYLKLLLRENFAQLLKSRGIIVCIPETIPDEIGMIPYQRSDEKEWKTRRVEDDLPRRPVALFADFADGRSIAGSILRRRMSLYQRPDDPNPFLPPPENPQFITFEEIEKDIRRLKRR